nr:putative nuclease HARBI1 [Tanacetum cinerariifolium]
MSRIQFWNETIERMACGLSKWKLKTVSIGVPKNVLHRMESMRSYFFNGAELSSKRSVWVKWKHALASKDKCGLGVSSLFALNRALMFKCVWRFITQGSSLWAKLDIIHDVEMFKSRGIDLVSLIHLKLGNRANTSFWEVARRGGSPFNSFFPRLYALETKKRLMWHQSSLIQVWMFRFVVLLGVVSNYSNSRHMKEKVEGCILADMMDRWFWALEGSSEFTITSVRKMVGGFMLPEVSSKTRWIKAVPIKAGRSRARLTIQMASHLSNCYAGWKNSRASWCIKGEPLTTVSAQYVRRDHGSNPFILLKVVASQDLWIWHAFFGVGGSNNDINVLYQSLLFNDLKTGRASEIPFVANGLTYRSGYYLADGIYMELVTLVKTIPEPADDEHKRILCKKRQELARKDVERSFGVIRKKWAILANPTPALRKDMIVNMMYTCIILHNMIRKYKKVAISPRWFPEEAHQTEDVL